MSAKEAFLKTYEQEHDRTMRLMRAYPSDKADYKPAANCRTAREIAWTFVLERGLGTAVMHDEYASRKPGSRTPPPPPEKWSDLIAALEKAHHDFGALIKGMSDEQLAGTVKFMVGPKQLGDWRRLDFAWFLLHDQIHHRGQLSVYLKAAGGKVPSIYGPSGDEPWT